MNRFELCYTRAPLSNYLGFRFCSECVDELEAQSPENGDLTVGEAPGSATVSGSSIPAMFTTYRTKEARNDILRRRGPQEGGRGDPRMGGSIPRGRCGLGEGMAIQSTDGRS